VLALDHIRLLPGLQLKYPVEAHEIGLSYPLLLAAGTGDYERIGMDGLRSLVFHFKFTIYAALIHSAPRLALQQQDMRITRRNFERHDQYQFRTRRYLEPDGGFIMGSRCLAHALARPM
jgi:hypothetical protein